MLLTCGINNEAAGVTSTAPPLTATALEAVMAKQNLSLIDRFMQYVTYEPNSGCWLWTGYVNPKGYGRINIKRRLVLTHRFLFEREYGPVPDGLMLRHKCDVKCCVNPDHLELGTNRDNVDDCLRRDGSGKKLNLKIVREIKRELYETDSHYGQNARLSEKYGIHSTGISSIKFGVKWAHVPWPDGTIGALKRGGK